VCSVEQRAARRLKDFEKLGISKTAKEIAVEIEERDRKDSTRTNSPLYKADDALVVDTTYMNIEEQVTYITERVLEKGLKTSNH
jgi:cytidylate kinase